MELKVKRLHPDAKLPAKAHVDDLGFDLFALETAGIQPGQTVAVKTGIAVAFPDGWGGIVKARSSQGKAGVNVLGGVIDHGYRGEIIVLIHNTNAPGEIVEGHYKGFYNYDPTVIYHPGDKVGQLVLVPVAAVDVQEVTSLSETERNTSGFGSTGK